MNDEYVWPEDPEAGGRSPEVAAGPPGPTMPESTVAPPPPGPIAGPSGNHTPPQGFRAQAAPAQFQPPPPPPVTQGAFGPPSAGFSSPPAQAVPTPPKIAERIAERRPSRHSQLQARPQGGGSGTSQTAPPPISGGRASVSMTGINVRAAAKLPPTRGWRHWLLKLGINVGLSPDEIYERDLHAKIRKIVDNHNEPDTTQIYQAAVMSVKGGVGKTAVTVLLGSALASIRKGHILAIDADPDAGNLVKRSGKQSEHTVAELVAAAEHLTTYNAVRAHTSMNDANLEVLASQDYVDAARAFSADDWNIATRVTSPFYPIILADCGTGMFHGSAKAILNSVWGVVIVAGTGVDEAEQAALTLDWLRGHGYADLIDRAVVVINHTEKGRGTVNLEEVKAQFAQHLRDEKQERVFELPFDPHIKEGKEINLQLVSRTTLRRITEVAAALSENFDRPRRIVVEP